MSVAAASKTRKVLSSFNWDMVINKCPEERLKEVKKMYQAYYSAVNNMNALPSNEIKLDLEKYKEKIRDKAAFERIAKAYEASRVELPDPKQGIEDTSEKMKTLLEEIDIVKKNASAPVGRWLNLARVNSTWVYKIDLYMNSLKDWIDVRLGWEYYGQQTRQNNHFVHMDMYDLMEIEEKNKKIEEAKKLEKRRNSWWYKALYGK